MFELLARALRASTGPSTSCALLAFRVRRVAFEIVSAGGGKWRASRRRFAGRESCLLRWLVLFRCRRSRLLLFQIADSGEALLNARGHANVARRRAMRWLHSEYSRRSRPSQDLRPREKYAYANRSCRAISWRRTIDHGGAGWDLPDASRFSRCDLRVRKSIGSFGAARSNRQLECRHELW